MRQSSPRPPIINAPPVVTALAVSLLVAHGVRVLGGSRIDEAILELGAVIPDRFWAWAGANTHAAVEAWSYNGPLAALAPVLLTAFVHGDWMHVILNAAMLVGIGKPVFLILSRRPSAASMFLFLFFASVAGGSLAHLLANHPTGPAAIGASGGVSGLLGALMLVQQAQGRLFSRAFLTVSGLFLGANILLALVGPALLGAAIAWQAHIGGYVAGALLMRGWLASQRSLRP